LTADYNEDRAKLMREQIEQELQKLQMAHGIATQVTTEDERVGTETAGEKSDFFNITEVDVAKPLSKSGRLIEDLDKLK